MSEDEGKAGNAQKKTGKQQKGRAWLKEGGEDDPLNFLDPKVSQRVLGNRASFTLLLIAAVSLSEAFYVLRGYLLTCFSLFLSHQPSAEKERQG